jgi:hypothetical protein
MKAARKGPVLLGLGLLALSLSALGGEPPLTHHVRDVVSNGAAQPVGRLPATQVLQLDVVLALRDPQGLGAFLKTLYDPGNPGYRHFLTVSQFTARFGPTQQDYNSVVDYAKAHGLAVVGGTRDGMDVQMRGSVAAIESAFHVTLGTYRHPTENRVFYAPSREPTADLPFALWHVSGLDNYSIPHPLLVSRTDYAKAHGMRPEEVAPLATTGSGPSGSFLGSDMRAAYYADTTLTGAGQNLGLLEYAGTDLTDLNTYFANVGQTNNVPVTQLSTDGTSTVCVNSAAGGYCDDTEQTIDMTQAISMAPGLASLVMYVGSTDTAILSAMTTHNPLPTTIGCSHTWAPPDPTVLDPYFEKMAAQGQTFFAASGDNSTWGTSTAMFDWTQPWPADNQYVVSVGGTDLETTGAGGAWLSETAWQESGGGSSPNGIAIPWWQALPGVINSSNRGSTTLRNGPDVAANANYNFYVCANQLACSQNVWGGTSFAAPMWAGYAALLNQQLAASGEPLAGFLDPMLYEIGLSTAYDTSFHDVTSGTSGSYSAVSGYDLVTGWGSPNGANLINVLARKPIMASELNTAASSNAVYYLGFDGNLYQITWGSQGWAAQQDTGSSGRPALAAGTSITAYVNTIYDGNEVFYLTSVNGSLHIEQLWGPTLSATDLTVSGQGGPRVVAPGSAPVGYIDSIAGTDNVFYIGVDHLIHALTWSPGNPWVESAALDESNPPAAVAGSPLVGHMNVASEEVFYIGANRHVYELWRWSKNFDGWHFTDVTAASGSNPVASATGPLAGFYDSVAGHDAVFYQGANQHVYELVFSNQAWSSVDVTGTMTPPAVGSALAAHVNSMAGTEEVFFLDSNQNVRALWAPSTNSSSWSETDVTTSSGGAPLAFPGSPLATHVSSTLDNTDHAFYLGEDRNVHELWFNGSWHFNDDSTSTNPAATEALP